jgi:2-C-methyl-D-erythritol 4-phosphate cytidylyltransferase
VQPWVIVPLPATLGSTAAFVPVAGEPPLIRVVRAMSRATSRARIVVASTPAHGDAAADCLRHGGLGAVPVAIACDPGARRDVLAAGLEHFGVERDSAVAVLVCDCRHPLSPSAVADRVIATLGDGHDVVVPTEPVTDTVKTVDANGSVLGTVDRTTLRTVQYPRGFTASTLWDLVAADDADEFDAALRAGLDVATVPGDPDAFQVELPRDARLLAAIIAGVRS